MGSIMGAYRVATGRIEVSSQNHNYAVDTNTLPQGVAVTHINLNDGTCAGERGGMKERGMLPPPPMQSYPFVHAAQSRAEQSRAEQSRLNKGALCT